MKFLKLINGLPIVAVLGLTGYWYWSQFGGATTIKHSLPKPPEKKVINSEEWQVTSVADGDTITVQRGSEEKDIRFCGIDAPEVKHGKKKPGQPFGNEARDKLRSLVAAANNEVIIIPVEQDRYGRLVAEVMAKGKSDSTGDISFQEEMLKSGLAYYYHQYAKNCPNHDAFEEAEKIAIEKKAGVWSRSDLEMPWDYRKRYR